MKNIITPEIIWTTAGFAKKEYCIFVIDKIKDILSNELDNKRVFDKDVAAALNLSKQSLSIVNS